MKAIISISPNHLTKGCELTVTNMVGLRTGKASVRNPMWLRVYEKVSTGDRFSTYGLLSFRK